MTISALSEADLRIRDEVVRELEWDPGVDAGAIGVTARDGVVALTGWVDTCPGKLAAERVAKRVRGVKGVANDLEVRLGAGRTDVDIARTAVRALELRGTVPASVQALVHDGYVTLTGKVDFPFQAQDAGDAVRHIRGVRGIFNHIEVAGDTGARRAGAPGITRADDEILTEPIDGGDEIC